MDLAATGLFGELPAAELRRLVAMAQHRWVPAGTVVVEVGRQANLFYLIAEGRIRVTIGDRPAVERGPGDWFGEAALVEGLPRQATVWAQTDLQLMAWDGVWLRELLARHPPVLQQVFEDLRRRAQQLGPHRI